MKKTIALVISLVLSSCIFAGEAASYSLFDALQKKLIKVIIKGRGTTSDNSSSHYGRCITVNVKNISQQRLDLTIEAGRKLKCYKDSVQSMVISQTEMFALGPGNSSDFTINAFCTSKHSGAPGVKNEFSMQGMAKGYLYELVKLIESLDCQDNMGQQAVWVLTDSISTANITGGDPVKAKKLKSFVEFAIKKVIINKDESYNYDYSYPEKNAKGYKISGEINWNMPYNGTVTLSIYDNKGKKILDVFTGVPYRPGFQSYSYELANDMFREGETYWLKIISAGQWLKEVAINMN